MRSTFSGLNTLVRGLYAQQLSLDTVSHNVANAATEGYSRQRVNLSTTLPETIFAAHGSLQVGTGVDIQSVVRLRNTFVDQQYWKENSSLGYAQTAEETLGKIEGVFTDDTTAGTGIQTVLNNFWQAWRTLATNSSNASAQTAVRERGAELVNSIQHASDQLRNLVTDVNSSIVGNVAKINEIGSEIANLNKQISNIEVGGMDNANDLRDRRDLLVDQLSKMANVRVFEDQDHNYSINISNVSLVSGSSYTKLAVASSPDPTYGFQVNRVVTAGANPQDVQFTDGQMYALQQANTADVPGYLDKLSTMSQYLLQEFNAVHRAGFGSDNTTGTNFFGDADKDYVASPLTDKASWLNALKINPALYNANGLNKIAIKTSAISDSTSNQTVSVVQSNANGGTGAVVGSYVPTDEKYHSFIIKVASVDASGHVTGIQYSLDGANYIPPSPATIPEISGKFNLDLSASGYSKGYGLSFSITDSVTTNPSNAVGDTYRFSVPQGNASGDNATNLANALKQPTDAAASVLKGASLDEYYGTLVAQIGISTQESKSLSSNQQMLINQITSWREQTSGVNLDEEMANMIKFQKGYGSAARVITTVDEMLDKLINSTGVVGR